MHPFKLALVVAGITPPLLAITLAAIKALFLFVILPVSAGLTAWAL